LTPPEGKYFALLSTGPGASGVQAQTTLTSIPYLITGNNPSVTFFLDFLSSQPSVDPLNNDFFKFNILGNPNSTAVSGDVTTDIASSAFSLIVPGSYVAAPDGTALTYHTGFGAYFADLSAYQGQVVEFQFLVSPVFCCPNFADSALLVDKVSGADLTAVPEPGSLLGLSIALVCLVVVRHRKNLLFLRTLNRGLGILDKASDRPRSQACR
jgi:hypothetical protein